MTTFQSVQVGTKEGKAFLRKIIKHNERCMMNEEWRAYAGPSNNWCWRFSRTIKGEVGEPDQHVEVQTDAKVCLPSDSKTGCEVQSFHDSKPVWVSRPRACYMNGDTAVVAKLLADGWAFEIEASAGSTSSSEYGIATYNVFAKMPNSYYGVYVGGETITVNGKQVVRSVVDVN